MGIKLRVVVWLLAFWLLAVDLYTWGGLALTPSIGKQLREQASVQSPLAATYLFLGRKAVHAAGLDDRARARVAGRYPEQIAQIDGPPETVMLRFLSAQSGSDRLAYYGAPLLLVLSLVLHARRQKRIRSFGTRN
jgi:hypothetical protein